VAFLYDLLGATQEHKIKPKKFPQTDIDEVIIGHTNEAEYKKLLNNEFMEALRDRTIKVDIPYITKLKDEIKIYKKDFNNEKVRGKHIAPHTIEMAAMWAVLTRLEEPKKARPQPPAEAQALQRQDPARLHQDNVKELRKESEREGMDGISARAMSRTRSATRWSASAARPASTPSWCSTSSRAASSSTRSSRTRTAQALLATCSPS
jgi:serine protein kinase